ncbi:MAG: diacylglycerol kinase [Candidatus Nealsonbacteria bacterium]|nr:diacylglycerol kinase [Candidatus Nealsonbacteria bacterium]
MFDSNLERKFNFGAVKETELYRSAQPDEEFLAYLKKTYRIKTIIALRFDVPEFEERFCKENNINLVRLPIKSWRRWPEPDEVQDLFKLFQYSWNLPVLVHCLKGKDRTSAVVALYRIGCEKWHLKDAVAEMKQWKANWFWRLFIQTRANKVIHGFKERRLVLLYLMRFLNLIFGIDGLIFVIRHEKNLQIFLSVETLLMLIPSLLGKLTLLEFTVLFGLFGVFNLAEIFNTAHERSVDIAQPNFDLRVKYVKDILAGGIIFFGVICMIVWTIFVFFL